MNNNAVYNFINSFAPFETQMEFDNAGLLVGDKNGTAEKALLALDITPATVEEAKNRGCTLIISHHPVIFHPLQILPKDSVPYLLAKNGMTAICAHTNLDMAAGGVNDVLCALLGIVCTQTQQASAEFRIGRLCTPVASDVFAKKVSEVLQGAVRFNSVNKPIMTVAVCSGAGGDYYMQAKQAGADALLTGEAKYHEYLDAAAAEFCILAAGHFETEQIMMPVLAQHLREAFPGETFLISEQKNPVQTVV